MTRFKQIQSHNNSKKDIADISGLCFETIRELHICLETTQEGLI